MIYIILYFPVLFAGQNIREKVWENSNYLNLVVSIRILYILCASNDEEPEFEDPDESFEVLTDMSEKIRKISPNNNSGFEIDIIMTIQLIYIGFFLVFFFSFSTRFIPSINHCTGMLQSFEIEHLFHKYECCPSKSVTSIIFKSERRD